MKQYSKSNLMIITYFWFLKWQIIVHEKFEVSCLLWRHLVGVGGATHPPPPPSLSVIVPLIFVRISIKFCHFCWFTTGPELSIHLSQLSGPSWLDCLLSWGPRDFPLSHLSKKCPEKRHCPRFPRWPKVRNGSQISMSVVLEILSETRRLFLFFIQISHSRPGCSWLKSQILSYGQLLP